MLSLENVRGERAGQLMDTAPKTRLRLLLIGGDPLSRRRLRDWLMTEREVEIAGECLDAGEAIGALIACRPDAVFLDDDSPRGSVLEALPLGQGAGGPSLVVASVETSRAIGALRAGAVDFLAKPLDPAGVKQALRRVRNDVAERRRTQARAGEAATLEGAETDRAFPQRLALRSPGRLRFLRVDAVDWIEADRNYVRIHHGGEVETLREPISSFERLLDPRRFVRIHRSTIVRTDSVSELQIDNHGDSVAVLADGTRLPVARPNRGRLEAAITDS